MAGYKRLKQLQVTIVQEKNRAYVILKTVDYRWVEVMINDALTFLFRGFRRYMLIIGDALSLMISFASFIPLLGYIIAIGASGYFAAYSFRIINTTAIGQDQACDWPDFRDFWSDLIAPWLCVLAGIFYGIYNYCIYTSGSPEHTIESKGGPIHYSEESPGHPGRRESTATGWKIAGIGILLIVFSMIICIIDEVLDGAIGKFQARTGRIRYL